MKTIYDAVRRGKPIDFTPYVDVHGHFGPWMDTCIPYARDEERVLAEMDRFGLSACDPADCLGEFKRCLARGRCIGVKMHRYNQPAYTLRSDFLQPVLELLEAERLVYMNHDLGDLEAVRSAAAKFPQLVFMGGHFNPGLNELAGEAPNVVNCTCAACGPDAVGAEVKRLRRSHALLVGSDFNLFCLSFGIGMIAYADIPEQDKRNILGVNAVRLMARTKWFKSSMLKCTKRG